jgi:hypothetical protein
MWKSKFMMKFSFYCRESSLHLSEKVHFILQVVIAELNCSARPTTAYKFTVASLRSPSHCAVKSTLGVVLKYTLRPFSRAGLWLLLIFVALHLRTRPARGPQLAQIELDAKHGDNFSLSAVQFYIMWSLSQCVEFTSQTSVLPWISSTVKRLDKEGN